MNWIDGIESIFGSVAPEKSPRAVVEEDDCGGKNRSGYAVVGHEGEGKKDLQHGL